jgi:hypothetical protein
MVAALVLGGVFCASGLISVYMNRTWCLFEIRKRVHKTGSREDRYVSLAMTDQVDDSYASRHLEDRLLGATPGGDGSFRDSFDMPSSEAASARRASLLEGQYNAPQAGFAPMKKRKKTFGQTRVLQ